VCLPEVCECKGRQPAMRCRQQHAWTAWQDNRALMTAAESMAEARFTDMGGGHWLLEGELGFTTVPELLQHAGADMCGVDSICVDLKGVTRVDSAGLALLIQWLRESERAGLPISFVNVPVQLLSIARVCGLEEILSLKTNHKHKQDNYEHASK
jgi:phospholipid transport system transporter-binding protein